MMCRWWRDRGPRALTGAAAQESDADLAKKLANPISSLVSLPFQFNYDCCIGPEEASKFTLNVQPVIPIGLNADWNMIVRTIVPVVYLEAPAMGLENEFGLSDTLQSFFFSPSRPMNGITWGIGPAFLWPTGTGPEIATGKWGAGPTGVILRQQGGWTYGLLANHVWSYANSFGHDRPEVSQTFLQPFLSHTFPDTTNISINTEFDLRLGNRTVDGPDQRRGQPRLQIRRAARQPGGLWPRLCSQSRRRS